MAPAKRRREEVVEVESASSSLRASNGSSKRARLAHPARAGTISSDGEGDAQQPVDEDEDAPAATQYDRLRDGNFEHLANPEEDDRWATQKLTQRLQQQSHTIGDNHAALNAIIEKITCINFMNHDRLEVELGPLINFIVGENGAGKSAVLTAVTLCLGGKASATNRGTSLKSLVKTGTEQGVLIVQLKNQGADAYQPDTYGDSIIVERHFSKNGSGGYKLKSATGRTISTKKGDVDDIVEYFQLQVNNPMMVLTQDAAKTFIQKSTMKDKYKFFYEGVQLQQLDNDYRVVSDTCDAIALQLEVIRENTLELQKKRESALQRQQAVERHGPLRRQRQIVGYKYAWSQVEDEERDLQKRQQQVIAYEQQIAEQEELEIKKDKAFQELEDIVNKAKEEVEAAKEDLTPLTIEEETAKEAFDEAKKDDIAAGKESNRIRDDLHNLKQALKTCEQHVSEELKRLADMNGGAHTRLLADIEQAKDQVVQAKHTYETHQGTQQSVEDKLTAARYAEDDAKHPLAAKQDEKQNVIRRLEQLQRDQRDPLDAYPPQVRQVLAILERDQGFQSRPIGPIGTHLQLKKPQWSSIIEKIFGATLNGFIVSCKADQDRLRKIFQRANLRGNIPIFIFRSQQDEVFDISRSEPDRDQDTVLRVLDIDNNVVTNHLLVNHNIDQLLLIEDHGAGNRYMFEGAAPRNVKSCFCIDGNRRGWGHRLFLTGGQAQRNPATDYVMPWEGRPRMTSNRPKEIAFFETSRRQLEQEYSALEDALRQRQQEKRAAERELAQHKDQTKKLKIAVQRAEEVEQRLQEDYDKVNIEDGKLDTLKEDVVQAQSEVDRVSRVYGEHGLSKKEISEKAITLKRALTAVKVRVAEQEKKIELAEQNLKRKSDARHLELTSKNSVHNEIIQLRGDLQTAQAKVVRQRQMVDEFAAKASQVSERVAIDEGETSESLKSKYESLCKQLEAWSRAQGATDDEIHIAAASAQELWEKNKAMQDKMEELLALLRQSFNKRIQDYRRFQRHVSARSRINFNYLLSERGFRGRLVIDHVQKLLDVHVEPDSAVKRGSGRDPKTLSGGEKSFANICLLLALWESMMAPLRCLDEFDVFMDNVNRDVTTSMIISAARRAVSRQFILISPNALGAGVDIGPDVKITRLEDPRNRQRRIDAMLGNGA